MGDNRGDTHTHTHAHTAAAEHEHQHECEREDEDESPRRDLNPLRAAGWIFRDGDCIAIERQGEDLRTRVLAD
jgi:hypothetical protein